MTDEQVVAELMAEIREDLGAEGPGVETIVKIAVAVVRKMRAGQEDDHK